MQEHIDKFLRYLEFEKGVSAHTLRAYRKDLKVFSGAVNTAPENIDVIDVRGFIAGQIKQGLNKTTVGRRLSSIRSFFKFLYREGFIRSNPAKLVSNPKMQKLLPRFLSVDDVFSLVEQPDGIGFLPARDRAILELLYSSGLRVSELSGLNTDEVNTKEHLVKVKGQGEKRADRTGRNKGNRCAQNISHRTLPPEKQGEGAVSEQTRHTIDRPGGKTYSSKICQTDGYEYPGRSACPEAYLCKSSPSGRCRPQGYPGAPGTFFTFYNTEIYSSRYNAFNGYI